MPKVLLIENEKFLRELYSDFLDMSSFEVKTAENGEDGLEILQFFTPDIILLDIKMPVMNGKEFLQVKKVNSVIRDIPVILLTGVSDMNEIDKCLELGATHCVKKSTHPVELLNTIENLLDEEINEIDESYNIPVDNTVILKNFSES